MTTKAKSIGFRNVVESIERPAWQETLNLAILLLLKFVILAVFSYGLRVLGIALRDLLMVSGGG